MLGSVARRIGHVGSTAVPGLAAKPIVDISVSVDDVDHDEVYRPAMERAGYELRVLELGHRMFRTPGRDVHVHFWPAGGDDERRHLVFRDWLRVDAADRRRYEEHKRELARRDWADMNDYAQAKNTIIDEIMRRARAWARQTEWQPE